MKVWMDVMRDLEHVMDDHERCLDTWQAGGVDGIVLGPMFFNAAKLLPGLKRPKGAPPSEAAFDPNPRIYEKLGVPVPPTPAAMPERRDLLGKMLTRAKDRGMTLMIFQPMMGMTPKDPGHSLADPAQRDNAIARMVDTFEQFPMVDGGVMDRPEWHYEMEPGRRMHPTFFDDLGEEIEPLCRRLGYDHAALVAAKDRLEHRLHHLDPRRVRMHESGGVFDGMSLLGNDPDLTAWFRFRIESVTDYFRQVREGLAAELDRPIKLGVGPRSAAFALLSGYDFESLGRPHRHGTPLRPNLVHLEQRPNRIRRDPRRAKPLRVAVARGGKPRRHGVRADARFLSGDRHPGNTTRVGRRRRS